MTPAQEALLRQRGDPFTAVSTLECHYPHLLADSTFRNLRGVMRQYCTWLTNPELDPWDENNFILWLGTKDIMSSTKLTYVKNFEQVRDWTIAAPLIRMKQELVNQGARIPEKQAPPADPSLLDDPRLTKSYHQRMQVWLAWKTASRWGDLQSLTLHDFIVPNPYTLIVDWSNKTKSSKRRPFRASRYTVIQGPRTPELLKWLSTLRDPIQWMKTPEAAALFKNVDPTLTAHSIKVGATKVLEWAVANKQLSLEIKSRVLKHDTRNPALEMSLQYGRSRVAQALSLETHLATRLL